MNQKIEFIIRDRRAQIESRTVWSVTSSHSASIARDYKKHAQNMILKPCLYGHVFALLNKQDFVFLFIILSALVSGQKVSLNLRSSQKRRRGRGKRMASTEKRKVLFYKIATKVNKNIFLRND